MDLKFEREEKDKAVEELMRAHPQNYKNLSEIERKKRRRKRMEALVAIQPQYKIFFQVHKDPVKEERR